MISDAAGTRISDSELEKWESIALENISRGYSAESVEMPTLNWAETNERILTLIKELQETRAALDSMIKRYLEIAHHHPGIPYLKMDLPEVESLGGSDDR